MNAEISAAGLGPRLRSAFLRILEGPFSHMYARRFFGGVALHVLVVMVMFEAVFLAERFPMVFRLVFDHHVSPWDTAFLFLCNGTQVFDLALAIAILMAVYWTTLRLRENRELLVLVAAGTGPGQLIALVMTIAVAAQLVSLTVSGVLDPASRYEQRVVLFNAQVRALQTGINTGQFYDFPNRVAYAPAENGHEGHARQTRGLFIYEQLRPDSFRVVTADHARLDGPDQYGRIVLRMGGLASHTFSHLMPEQTGDKACIDCRQEGAVSGVALSASDVTQAMTIDQLLTFMPRGSESEEVTVFEQFTRDDTLSAKRHREDMKLLGERLSRSFLCLLAPLIALASVCLTTRSTNYFVLPLACMGLMSLNVTSEWLIRVIVPLDPIGALRVPAIVTMVMAALLLAEIIHKQGRLALPQLARP
jgi:lipopolysaccharide export LptBFGC system permease protein LptF